MIARIYEVDPLVCKCGKEIKITRIVTNPLEIRFILCKIGWPVGVPEFEPPEDFPEIEISQLIPGTEDGFYEESTDFFIESGSDPPFFDECVDPPHWEEDSQSPHCEGFFSAD